MKRSTITILLTSSFILGNILSFFYSLPLNIIVLNLGGFFLLSLFLNNRFRIPTLAISFFLLPLLLLHFDHQRYQSPRDYAGEEKTRAVVISEPAVKTDSQQVVLQSGFGRILANLDRYPELEYGQEVLLDSNLQPISQLEKGYQNYLKSQHIAYLARFPKIEIIGQGKGNKLLGILLKLKRGFTDNLTRALPEPEASLSAAILVGARSSLPEELGQDFQKTGLTHIVAISGYNVTIILVYLWLAFRYLSPRFAYLSSTLFIPIFVVFTGSSASVIRGGIIAFLILTAKYLGRRTNSAILILLSASLMLLFNPWLLLYDIGFQLSFLAFVGLLYFSPLYQKMMARLTVLPPLARSVLGETFAAQTLVLPYLIFRFGTLSLISPLSNLLILPIIPLSMLLTFLTGLLGYFSNLVAQIVGFASWLSLHYIVTLNHTLANLSWSSVNLKINWVILLLVYLVIGGIYKKWLKNSLT